MKKVDLIIVGAQKAGTTSLNNYLKSHPTLVGHEMVEFSFFADAKEYEKGFENAFSTYFDNKKYSHIVAKNVTITLVEESLVRLKEHNPDTKLVFVLREPVSRAYSAYTMAVKDGWMNRPFSDLGQALNTKSYDDIMYRHFVKHGLYAKQLKTVLKYFPAKNIKLFLFEDLKQNPQLVCDNIFDWLDVPSTAINVEAHNVTYKPASGKIATLINKVRNPQNPINRLVKAILPYSLFKKIKNKILKLNTSTEKFEPISQDMKIDLLAHFEQPNKELAEMLKTVELENCLTTFKSDNWLSKLLSSNPSS